MKKICGYLSFDKRKKVFFVTALLCVSLFLATFSKNLTATVNDMQKDTELLILMYHSILDDESRSGKYIITPKALEEDMLYLKEKGYEFITVSDLISYKNNQRDLPQKCVTLTFDDGYYNNYNYLFPLLKKHNLKAVLSVVGIYADMYSKEGEVMNNNYSHATWTQLKEMSESGLVEIENHSYNMHDYAVRKGILRNKNEDKHHYKILLNEDILKMQERMKKYIGEEPACFTYPFGSVNEEAREIVESFGFEVTLGCEEGINKISRESSFKDLKRYNRHGAKTTSEFFEKIG